MRISSSQMFRNFNKWCLGTVTAMLFAGSFQANAQGEALFKAKCASCHQPFKDGTGPKLFQVRTKWADGGAKDGSIYQWVNNFQAAMAADPYAKAVSAYSGTNMQQFPELKKEDIDAIFDYIDALPDPATATPEEGAVDGTGGGDVVEEESSNTWVWILLAVIFAVVIGAISGVRRQLKTAVSEAEGSGADAATYTEELKTWAWKNRKYVGLGALVVVISLIVWSFLGLYTIGVVEDYHPSQPIQFPHSVHAGKNKIDCKYCHNSVTESRTAGIPSVNVCMNCHKQVQGTTAAQQEQIKKIYEHAGFIPEGAGKYTGKTKPIVWNKVHVLPDHVYFNHSQHVVVGGIDCKQCHGDMTKQVETQKVWPVEELNKLEGNIVLTRPTLTMGWCIECHDQKEVSTGTLDTKKSGYYDEIHKRLLNNDKSLYGKYLEDGKVSVKELGGWECAKCHY